MTVGGSPCLYSGDEQGYLGRKEDGDPSLRPAFPASPEGFLPIGWATHDLYRTLIALRRRHDWLGRARTRVLASTSTALLYEVHDDWRRLLVALNCGDGEVPLDLDLAYRVEAGGLRHDPDVAGGRPRLPEHGWAVLAPAA
jgi:glycosidase